MTSIPASVQKIGSNYTSCQIFHIAGCEREVIETYMVKKRNQNGTNPIGIIEEAVLVDIELDQFLRHPFDQISQMLFHKCKSRKEDSPW